MNNMLRYVVYILLFLLFTITVGQDYYTVETNRFTPTDLLLPATTRPLQKNSGFPVYQQFCRYATNSHIT